MSAIAQALAVSYPAVLLDMRKPSNQWAESALMNEMERQGMIVRESLGPTIETTLDYQRNPGTAFLATDLEPVATTQTDVLNAASYTPAQISVPMVWSKMQEATNPAPNQKVALVKSLIENGINSHDDAVEQALFTTTTNGFLGLLTHITDAGTGSDGGIDSGTETYWRNQQASYTDDTDIESSMTTVWNACAKGSGSRLQPTLLTCGGTTHALFESTQQALQRYEDQNFAAGAKTLVFKSARFIFSQYGSTRIFFLNKTNFQLIVSKQFFRDREETQPFPSVNGYISKIYSALQSVTNNRSRLGVCHL